MRTFLKAKVFSVPTVMVLLAALAEAAKPPLSIPAGTVLYVKLNTTLTSKTIVLQRSRPGARSAQNSRRGRAAEGEEDIDR